MKLKIPPSAAPNRKHDIHYDLNHRKTAFSYCRGAFNAVQSGVFISSSLIFSYNEKKEPIVPYTPSAAWMDVRFRLNKL